MVDKLPQFPRIVKGRSLATGRGSFWYKVWQDEYKAEGGMMGYKSWIEANIDAARKRRKRAKK